MTFFRILLLALGLSLLATAARAAPQPVDRIVAVVNDAVIVKSELDAAIAETEQRLERSGSDGRMPPRDLLEKRVLEQLVMTELQLQQAASVGIRVDDQQVNEALRRIADQNHLTLTQFSQVLEREGMPFARFREKVRKEMIITKLRQREVVNRITVTDEEADAFVEQAKTLGGDNREYHLAHILVSVPPEATSEQARAARLEVEQVLGRLRSGADFTQTAMHVSDGRHSLEGGDLGWRKREQIPTLFAEVVAKLAPGEVSDPIRSPSGYHLVKLLEVRGGERMMVTQTHARHILIMPDEVHSEQEVKTRLEQLRLRIVGGEDFATLARGHSQDRVSAANGGDLGWVTPGTMVPEFESVMDGLAPGEVSPVFKSKFGYHIVQVLERRNHDSTADMQRAKAREIIGKRKSEEALENWLRQLRGDAFVEYRLNDDY
ncbi:peptidylprolyl isomerase [Endothiovibrio diazotrophicus]